MAREFERTYPKLASWVRNQGWIEIGVDGFSHSTVRVLDEGGLIWEGGDTEATVDDVLMAANAAVERWERGELDPP